MSNFKTKVQTKTKRVARNLINTTKINKNAERSSSNDFYLLESESSYVARSSGIYDNYRSTISYDNDWN